MASQDNLTILQHKATGEVYYTRKNRKKLANSKLKLKKYSPKLNKHVVFEEVKKAGAKKPAKQEGGKKKEKKSEEQ